MIEHVEDEESWRFYILGDPLGSHVKTRSLGSEGSGGSNFKIILKTGHAISSVSMYIYIYIYTYICGMRKSAAKKL